MTPKEQNEINKAIMFKQEFFQKAAITLKNRKIEKALRYLKIEAGWTETLIKILEDVREIKDDAAKHR